MDENHPERLATFADLERFAEDARRTRTNQSNRETALATAAAISQTEDGNDMTATAVLKTAHRLLAFLEGVEPTTAAPAGVQ